MKKLNQKGFILAETLVVSVFLMILFTMIYTNFYPIIGIYEERENYDDVDGKYTAFWIKKLIESDAYNLDAIEIEADTPAAAAAAALARKQALISCMNRNGYIRFECKDVSKKDNQRDICISLVNSLDIANCDRDGNNCDIYITRYQIGNATGTPSPKPSFKDTVRTNEIFRYNETCTDPNKANCKVAIYTSCCTKKGFECITPAGENHCSPGNGLSDEPTYPGEKSDANDAIAKQCQRLTLSRVFTSATRDYVLSLPNYTKKHNTTNANYRVIVVTHNQKDQNDFYGYSTIEVIK